MEENKTEENKTETQSNTIAFFMDANILNAHMLAYSKDTARISMFKAINFRCKDKALHIATTDGRMLLHTILTGREMAQLPDFNRTFLLDRSIKCGKRGGAIVTIKGDVMRIDATGCNIPQLFPEQDADVPYPNYFQCEIEEGDRIEPKVYKNFNSEILVKVSKYIPENKGITYDSARYPDGVRMRIDVDDDVVKIATFMPLRTV